MSIEKKIILALKLITLHPLKIIINSINIFVNASGVDCDLFFISNIL